MIIEETNLINLIINSFNIGYFIGIFVTIFIIIYISYIIELYNNAKLYIYLRETKQLQKYAEWKKENTKILRWVKK